MQEMRSKLFAQPRSIKGFGTPETIAVSIPPTMMQPGPADDRFAWSMLATSGGTILRLRPRHSAGL
jgi:hypothetical protein